MDEILDADRIKTAARLKEVLGSLVAGTITAPIFQKFFINVGWMDGNITSELQKATEYWPRPGNNYQNRNRVDEGIVLNLRNYKLMGPEPATRKLERATCIAEICGPSDRAVAFLVLFLLRVVAKTEPRLAAHFAQRAARCTKNKVGLSSAEYLTLRDAFLENPEGGQVLFAYAAQRAADGFQVHFDIDSYE